MPSVDSKKYDIMLEFEITFLQVSQQATSLYAKMYGNENILKIFYLIGRSVYRHMTQKFINIFEKK